jgi:drug/metabolite transporter (DMT)-like permease
MLGIVFLKEIVSKREFVGLGLIILGTIITVIQPLINGSTFGSDNFSGNIIIVVASIIWSVFVLMSKRMFGHFSPILITLHGSIIALICYFPLSLWENNFSFPPIITILSEPTALFGIFYMSFLSYILAYILYEYGLSKIEISEASMFSYLKPIFAAPVAVLWLGETVTAPFLVGAAIITTGVVLNEWK